MLIVSDDLFNRNERYPKILVVHLTSVARLGGPFDWEVPLPKNTAGVEKASIIKCAEVYTLDKGQLQSRIGSVPRESMRKVDRALAIALALPPGAAG